MNVIIDIETGPLPDEQLAKLMPAFEASKVLKDPEKIKADLAAKEQAWRDAAALDAKYGQVLAIGIIDDEGERVLAGPEKNLIMAVWEMWERKDRFIGFCIKTFDFPFLAQRAWALGLPVPFLMLSRHRYWNEELVDLQQIWTLYGRETKGQSLDSICRACGLPGKNGSGRDFASLFATDRQAAEDYLLHDLEITHALAVRLGIIKSVPF